MTSSNHIIKEPCQVLHDVATSTLEDWGMMLTESSTYDSFSPHGQQKLFATTIKLKGPYSGDIEIIASQSFAEVLHQNLAGDFETDITSAELQDCLKEMANVTAGRIITEIFGEDAVYDLTDLSCVECDSTQLENFNAKETKIYILGDDCPVGFSLKL